MAPRAISKQTYSRIADFWKERYRKDVVLFLRDCIKEHRLSPTRESVRKLITDKLNLVWQTDECDLACLVLK